MRFALQSSEWRKKMIPAAVAVGFLLISLACGASLLFAMVMLLWAGLLCYTFRDLTNRAGYMVFLLAFFLFLLGGEFFELYLGYPQEFTFVSELDNHAYIVLFVSLVFLHVGFCGANHFQDRKKKEANKVERKDDPEKIQKLQKIVRIMMYVSVIPYFLKTLDAGLYTMENGYLSYYTEYKSRLPGLVDTVSEWYTMFFFLYLATFPAKKDCIIPLGLYIVHGGVAMLTGRRISIGIAVLVVMFYVIIRHGRDKSERWINRKLVIAVLMACPIMILVLHMQRYRRYGEAVEGGGILDMAFRFLSQQGSSISVLKLQKELEGDPLSCTSLYYTIHYLRGNVITRYFVDFPMEYYTERSVNTALYTNCLADYIMYMVNAEDFFAGYGLGTSYIAELNHDLGLFGVALGSAVYGGLLNWLYAPKYFSYWKFALGLMMLEEFVILPRYGADVILRPFYNLTKMLVLGCLFLIVRLSEEDKAKIKDLLEKKGAGKMLRKLKSMISTRNVMLHTPPMGEIRHITDEEVKELQVVMLQIIKDVAEVCEKHGICYMADGGTALGSVRHKGFIPWDDDVDLIMPRDDLNRFVEIFDQELGDKYDLITPNSPGHKVASLITEIYAKNTYKSSLHNMGNDLPQGVMIDIFPLEYAPLNPVVRRIKGTVAMILQYIAVSATFYNLYDSPVKKEFFYQTKEGKFNYNFRRMIGFLFSFRSYDKWCNTFDKFVRGKKDTGLWCIPTDVGHYFGHLMPKDVFYPPIKGQFEDMQINLPNNTHEYLVNAYGDYMWIPPVEEREKHWTVGFCMDLAAEEAKKKV